MRGWEHDQRNARETRAVLACAPGASGPAGPGAGAAAPAAVGGHHRHCAEAGLYDGDAPALVRETERDTGEWPGPTRAETDRVKALEREVRELRRTNEILRAASAFVAAAELDRRMR